MVALDHASGERYADDLSGIVRRLFDQRARERRLPGGACLAGRCHATDGVIHVLSEELPLEYHLELIVGWMDELDMKGG